MKKLFFALIISSFSLHAQDTIRFRNGEVKAVKVTEVGLTEIKYNRFDNVGGPLYVTPKNDVHYIKYAVGEIDSFPLIKTEIKEIQKTARVSLEQNIAQNGPGKIIIQRNKLYLNNKAVGESRLLKLIMAHPDNSKQNMMLKSFKEMKGFKKKQYAFGIVGLAVGVGAPYVGFFAYLLSYPYSAPEYFLGGLLVGAAVGVPCAIISTIQKHKRLKKKLDVARIYNGDL